MRHQVKYLWIVLLIAAVLVCIACTTEPDVSAGTAAPTAIPTPVAVVEVDFDFSVTQDPNEATAIPTPEPTPTPDPTPTPAPTEIPFSYYAPTVNMSFEELVGCLDDFDEENPKSDEKFRFPEAYPAPDKYYIIVDLYWQVVMVYEKDENGEYTVPVRYMLCSTGSPKYSETRQGIWNIQPCKVRFGKFNVTGECAQYWTLIRSRTYFHSVLYDDYRDLNSYDEDCYEDLGTKASHACIRLTVPDARWIFYNICYDTVCEIREGSKNDEATKAIKEQLKLAPLPEERVKITVAGTPYTDNWTIDGIVTDPDYPYIFATQPPVPKD